VAGLLPVLFGICAMVAASDPSPSRIREPLVQALLSADAEEQERLVRQLADSPDQLVPQTLAAWREGAVFLYETTNQARIPFLLDAQTDTAGRARAIRVDNGEFLADTNGRPALFLFAELTPVDTTSKLRKAIKTTLDLLSLNHPNPNARRDAVYKLSADQNPDFIPFFRNRLAKERDDRVRKALEEATAITQLAAADRATRLGAIRKLGELTSIAGLSPLKEMAKRARARPGALDSASMNAVGEAIQRIESHIALGNLLGTAFRGLSLASVLLVVALGLAITFGLMGVINMAHGEIMMVGAYTAYVCQKGFQRLGAGGAELYFIPALALAFVVAALVGLALERGIIRFLYKRPLESLLATWGVSLVLQQVFRATFGAANVQVNSPQWLSGSYAIEDVLFAYNRLFVIAFALFIVGLTYFLLNRTSMGLQVRAVMQNRAMASCLGVRTGRVNMMTFAFGSGLAGMAGACLSQIGNVGPSLGQNYIVDCFMIVVLGGVGNLVGTISAALGVGITDQVLQPFLGAVLGKIMVLTAIILFLQWRPAGLFVARSRGLES
jgi:urea transport system permease protein